MQPPRKPDITSFEHASLLVDAFERLLASRGVVIGTGSELEHGCLVLKELYEQHMRAKAGMSTAAWPKLRDDLQRSIGILNLMQLILAHAEHPSFDALLPHLRLLSEGAACQTKAAPATDSVSNKLFELRLALACIRTGTDLILDDPVRSSGGKNPDIMCRMRDGRIWGFACKVIHGKAPMSLFQLLESGTNQIERSIADVGLVVTSLKNRLPHEGLFPELVPTEGPDGPILGVQRDWANAALALSAIFRERVDEMVKHVGVEEVAHVLRGKKALPAIACPLETVIGVSTGGRPVPTILSFLHTVRMDWGVAKRLDHDAERILDDVNSGLAVGRPA